MTTADFSGHSHYSVIFHYAGAVAGLAAPEPMPALQALREILPALPSPAALADPADPPPRSNEEAVALVATALDLLPHLEANETSSPIGWETIARLRHALGELSAQLGAAIRREKASLVRGLYVIIDPEVTAGREPLDIAKAAVSGGARMLQLRDKLRDKGETLPLAVALQELCQRNGVQLIINDHADLAAAVGPDHVGLHVGQTDLPVAEARKILAPGQVLGRSNREIDLIIESQQMGADHVAFGAMYRTTTKQVTRNPQGPERLKAARAAAQVPLVAIGGITAENVAPVVEAGADAICVTAAVGSAANPEAAAAALTEAIRSAGGRV
jgi:thiamine-phosphate pyrophosphorylase